MFQQIEVDEYTGQLADGLPNPYNLSETAILRMYGVTAVVLCIDWLRLETLYWLMSMDSFLISTFLLLLDTYTLLIKMIT